MSEPVFWLIACSTKTTTVVPALKLDTYDDAVTYARELAQLNPGKSFYVAEARARVEADDATAPIPLSGGVPPF